MVEMGKVCSHVHVTIPDVAPSFEQMSVSIQETIQQSLGSEIDSHEDLVLTTEHQMLMTWCWLNIRVSEDL